MQRVAVARAAADPAARALVDSGRPAEPFWHTDSPLTTASLRRPCTGRPAVLERPSSSTIEAALRRALADREESGHGPLPTIR